MVEGTVENVQEGKLRRLVVEIRTRLATQVIKLLNL